MKTLDTILTITAWTLGVAIVSVTVGWAVHPIVGGLTAWAICAMSARALRS